MTPESQTIMDTLLAEGWREYPDPIWPKRRMFYKLFSGHAKCRCNEPKDKQVEVYWNSPVTFDNGLTMPESWKVDNVGELPDGQWLRMSIEGLKTHEEITRAVNQLLAGWDHVVSITPFVPDPGDQ